jgi:hypothetical protein
MNKLFSLSALLMLLSFTLFTACEKDDVNVSEDVEFYVNSSVFDLEEKGNCGRFGCFEFVFPITIEFENGDTVEVEDYEGLRMAIRDWKEANSNAEQRPNFAFPLEVMDEEGNLISIASSEELRELRKECRRDFFKRMRHRRGKHRGDVCFRPVYPLTVALPDGSTVTGENPRALKLRVRAWKAENRDSEERPQLVFPIEVKYKDGSTVTVGSAVEMKDLKDACSAEAEDEDSDG